MAAGPLKKGVCKKKYIEEISREINNSMISQYYYGSRESNNIYSDTAVEMC